MRGRPALSVRRNLIGHARYVTPALEKGLDILELLAFAPEALGRSEIARRLGRTISEVFRMLVCLEDRGYICQVAPGDRYQLTLRLFELSHQQHPLQRLVGQARTLMQKVAWQTGQSCHLAMLNNAEVVVVAQVDAPGNMGFSLRLGAKVELLNTASGHVILAFQDEAVRARTLAEWKKRMGKSRPTGLPRHLLAIRSRGYEELASYQVRGVVNISFPVLNQHGEAIAAMAVPFVARIGARIGPKQVREALGSATQILSASLGARKPELAARSN